MELHDGLVPSGTSIQSRRTATWRPKTRWPHWTWSSSNRAGAVCFQGFSSVPYAPAFAVIRKLKDIALHLKDSFKTILLVSPFGNSSELEKEITVLNFPLPTRDDLSELLDKIVAEVKEFKQVAIDLAKPDRERLLQALLV